jgi:hypothetical protein
MRFKDTHQDWLKRRLTQEEGARLLGVSGWTFRRYMARYEEDGVDGLLDKRLSSASHRNLFSKPYIRYSAVRRLFLASLPGNCPHQCMFSASHNICLHYMKYDFIYGNED